MLMINVLHRTVLLNYKICCLKHCSLYKRKNTINDNNDDQDSDDDEGKDGKLQSIYY